jgi:hypothetical protein
VLEPLPDGGIRLRLSRDERALLVGLTGELRSLLEVAPEDASLRRLFPPAYDDDADEHAYRELTGESLLGGRREALELLEQTVDREQLTAKEADAWLRALNDLRLVLGTRLDVQEDTFASEPDLSDPRGQALAVYGYLSWLQEQLVEALARD